MERTQAFFLGFVMSGIFGLLSSWLLASFISVDKTFNRMFSDIPRPKLSDCCIDTDIKQPPLQVLSGGCIRIFVQVILQIFLLGLIGVVIWFLPRQDLPQEFFVGVFFAAAFGFLLQRIRKNWKQLSNAFKRIAVDPPKATLNNINSPNQHTVAARPPAPAYPVFVEGALEIAWRLVWQIVLVLTLILSFRGAYFYLVG